MIISKIEITPAVAVFGTLFIVSLILFIRILCTQDGREFVGKLFKDFFMLK